jgi:23S rRNA (guanosine2251-2'-O)-methyltransferase
LDDRLIFGVHAVAEALAANPKSISEVWVAPGPHRPPVAALLADAGRHRIRVTEQPMRALDQRAHGERHQGVIAAAAAFAYADFAERLAALAQAPHALVVLADSLQDPHNLGAIVRSALAFGAGMLVITKDRCVQVTAVAERASAGTTAHLPIARVTNLRRAMDELKDAGFWIIGAAAEGGQLVHTFSFPDKVALVVGAEGDGLRSGTEKALDVALTIPLHPLAESLNASNAAAVLMYEIHRQTLLAEKK